MIYPDEVAPTPRVLRALLRYEQRLARAYQAAPIIDRADDPNDFKCSTLAGEITAYDVHERPSDIGWPRLPHVRAKAKAIIEGRAPWPPKARRWKRDWESAYRAGQTDVIPPWLDPQNLTMGQRMRLRAQRGTK